MSNKKLNILLLSLYFCIVSQISYAQSEEEELEFALGDEQFISIATGRQKLISKAPAVTSIITAEQIFKSGARTIDDVLESIP
ncbi:MAG: TonB-dependent receptor, partial [Gammaproteobacteria bacterium]|nr:TonB-dependent receptor [Gammaproteobacteria bacterium]